MQRYFRCWTTSRHCADIVNVTSLPSRPGEFHPEPLTDPDLILSHHPAHRRDRILEQSLGIFLCLTARLAGPAAKLPRLLTRCLRESRLWLQIKMYLILLAHPTRFERVTFA